MKHDTKYALKEIGTWFVVWIGVTTAIAAGIVLSEYLKWIMLVAIL